MDDTQFLYSFCIDEQGTAKKSAAENIISDNETSKKYQWIHMCALDPKTRDFLKNHVRMDPLIVDAMLAEETRPRALLRDGCLLLNLRAMNLNDSEDTENMISLRIWVGENFIITTRRREIAAIDDVVEMIAAGKAPATTADFLVAITDRIYQRMEPFLEDLEKKIAHFEDLLILGKIKEICDAAVATRRRTTIFCRHIIPQKIALETAMHSDFAWITNDHRQHLTESLDRVMRYTEELHELRDRAQIVIDGINSAHQGRLHEITFIFSIVATVFLPLGFLTGLLGVNLGGIPGTDDNVAFWIFLALCATIIIGQILMFKKLKWF